VRWLRGEIFAEFGAPQAPCWRGMFMSVDRRISRCLMRPMLQWKLGRARLSLPNSPLASRHFRILMRSQHPFLMRTTLDLPDSLFKEVKTRAVQQGVTLKELLATYIEAGLRGPQRSGRDTVLRNPNSLPVAWEADGTVTPARSNAELYAILEEDEVASFHRASNQSQPRP
jgi:hypothetical protein